MNLTLHWSLPLVFASVTGTVFAVAKLLQSSDGRVDDRIRNFHGGPAGQASGERTAAKTEEKGPPSPWKLLLVQVATYLQPRKAENRGKLHRELIEAGYYAPSAPMKFLLIQVAIAAFLGMSLLWGCQAFKLGSTDSLLGFVIGGCLGYLLPGLWLRKRKKERLLILRRSLPDFLDLTITCLQAGMTIEATMQRVSREIEPAHPLLAGELARVQHEIEIGSTPDRALQNFGERTDCDTVRSIAMVCAQSRKFGTKLASALRTHADALRERREHDAEEQAQKAAVKILIPTLLCLFPCVFVILAGPAAIQIMDEFGQTKQAAAAEPAPTSDP